MQVDTYRINWTYTREAMPDTTRKVIACGTLPFKGWGGADGCFVLNDIPNAEYCKWIYADDPSIAEHTYYWIPEMGWTHKRNMSDEQKACIVDEWGEYVPPTLPYWNK